MTRVAGFSGIAAILWDAGTPTIKDKLVGGRQ
jgi:hypothetical protein